MRLELTGRHVAITPAVRQAVEHSLARMARMLNESIVSVQVVIMRERSRLRVEMTLHARGDHFMHGAATGRDLAAALAAAADKIEHQAQKLKSRWTESKRGRRGVAAATSPAPEAPADNAVRIVRARRYAVKPMSVDEAALEVGARQGAFLVFRNAATNSVNVLFRRPDGHLGLIEPEA
jgi:putative sigma-54 modulation protein